MRTIYIIGDSTVENGSDPYYGWGGQLIEYVPGFRVENNAVSGRSSKSFWDEQRFEPVAAAMRAGDLLIICFGHNDEKDDEERHTDPDTSFPDMLRRYCIAARTAGAVPVLCTSVSRNYFADNSFVLYTHGAYPQAVRALCMREAVSLVDLEKLTRDLLKELGILQASELYVNIPPGADARYPDGVADRTHFSLSGAKRVAALVAKALQENGLL